MVHEPSAFQFEIAIEKLTGNKSPSNDQIPVEMIKVGNRTIHFEIHKLINSIWNEEELPEEWKVSIIVPICKKRDKTDCCNYRRISLFSSTHKILSNILLSKLTPYTEEIIGDHQCGFRRNGSTTDLHSAFIKCLRKNCNTMKQCFNYLWTPRKPMIRLARGLE
jgi:hypothetical protein